YTAWSALMSTNANRFCPNCGLPAEPGQRFCADCGSAIDATTVNPNPTEFKPGSSTPDLNTFPPGQEAVPPSPYISGAPTPTPPPQPPPPDVFQSSTTVDNYQTPQPSYQPVPDFARPQKGATTRTGIGLLGILAVVVALILIAGGAFY